MPKYESFTQYLTINYSQVLFTELGKFILSEARKECKDERLPYSYKDV